MPLTPEEQQRIYEEEKARSEARNRIEEEEKTRIRERDLAGIAEKQKRQAQGSKSCLGCFGFFALLMVAITLMKPNGYSPDPSESTKPLSLQAQKQSQRQEIAERKKGLREAEERHRKATEEYNADDLVLMLKTVEGTRGEFGGDITGIVVNQRNHTLNYAQISFNLYDKSGAQVGSALANINGLEPGAKWRFKASTLGRDFATYKLSELTGF